MASKFADELFNKWLGQGYGEGGFTKLVDAELTEVREVLEQAEREWMGPHDYEHEIGVIPKDVECDQCELVKRARTLYEKLRTDK